MAEEKELIPKEEIIETPDVIEPEVKAEVKPEPQKESAQATNFRNLRENLEKTEKERDEALNKYRDLASQQSAAKEEVDDLGISETDLVEGRHVKKVSKEVRRLQKELDSYKKEATKDLDQYKMTAIETKLKAQYPDFDTVVSKENVEKLKLAYPEMAQTLGSSTDAYSTGVTAYNMLKKFIVSSDDNYSEDKSKAEENFSKPRPALSISATASNTPLSQADAFAKGLTDDLKTQLYKEMIEARKKI